MPAALVVAGLAAFDNDPPFHTKVFPALVAVNVDEEFVQVIAVPVAEEIVGGVVLDVTVTFCVDVHPFVGSVAVTV